MEAIAIGKKAQILVIDANARNAVYLEQMLSAPDRGITSATNAKDALKTALDKEFDLILLDVQLPGNQGPEIALILKTNRRTRDIPIIFVSDEKAPVEPPPATGIIDYLYKPLDAAVTKARVSALLLQYWQKKELAQKNALLEKYALLIDSSTDLICSLDARSLKFEEVNPAATRILGYSPEELKGTSLLFYLDEQHRQRIQQLSRENQEHFSFETDIWVKDRSTRLLSWNVISRNGQWFAGARDITGAREAEEIKNCLAAVVRQSNDAIYLHDADGGIISWNRGAEKIYGFTEKEALKMKLWNIVPGPLLAEAQELFNSLLEGAEVRSVETTRITKKGDIIDVLFSASVVLDAENNLRSIAITERDITAEKQAKREIEKALAEASQANKELESFSYSVSHDLRAPLRALNGYSHMLEEDFQQVLDEEGRRLLGNIRYNARRMGMLIDDLLAFSRLGRKELQRSPLSIADLVGEVLRELAGPLTGRATIEVHDLRPAYGDRSLLRQVWINLISNALKYSSKTALPRITIGSLPETANRESGYYVQDNGVGFNMEYAGKLFGVFQRLHRDEDFEGTGVGLAIVHRIVSRHGGKVWAKGEPGEGATFYFSLPWDRASAR